MENLPKKRGPKPKYNNPKRLKEAVDAYFRSIAYVETLKDEEGCVMMNLNGGYIQVLRYAVPPTIEALCLTIGITDRTWRNYEKDEKLGPVCEEAKARVKAWLMEQLNSRDKTQGIQFNLANNFGQSEKFEIKSEGMSLEEMEAVLKGYKGEDE